MKHTHRGRCNPNRECYQGTKYTKIKPEPTVAPTAVELDPSLCKTCGKSAKQSTMFCGNESHGYRPQTDQTQKLQDWIENDQRN